MLAEAYCVIIQINTNNMTIITSIPWIQQVKSRNNRHEKILQHLGADLEKSSATINHEKSPVNLCILDGGGMKGKQKSSYTYIVCSCYPSQFRALKYGSFLLNNP